MALTVTPFLWVRNLSTEEPEAQCNVFRESGCGQACSPLRAHLGENLLPSSPTWWPVHLRRSPCRNHTGLAMGLAPDRLLTRVITQGGSHSFFYDLISEVTGHYFY